MNRVSAASTTCTSLCTSLQHQEMQAIPRLAATSSWCDMKVEILDPKHLAQCPLPCIRVYALIPRISKHSLCLVKGLIQRRNTVHLWPSEEAILHGGHSRSTLSSRTTLDRGHAT